LYYFLTQNVYFWGKENYRIMLTKDRIHTTLEQMPDSFSIDELIDQLIFIERIEDGIQQSEEGKVVSNEDVQLMINKWSK
jgi:hypothetical protein